MNPSKYDNGILETLVK